MKKHHSEFAVAMVAPRRELTLCHTEYTKQVDAAWLYVTRLSFGVTHMERTWA